MDKRSASPPIGHLVEKRKAREYRENERLRIHCGLLKLLWKIGHGHSQSVIRFGAEMRRTDNDHLHNLQFPQSTINAQPIVVIIR